MTQTAERPPTRQREGDPLETFSLGSDNFQGSKPTECAVQGELERVRLRYLARRLHALGPAPLAHFLNELAHGADLRASLEEYARPFVLDGGRAP
jgi:hypothetical protein